MIAGGVCSVWSPTYLHFSKDLQFCKAEVLTASHNFLLLFSELVAEEHLAVDARVYTYALALKCAAEKPLQVPFMKF